MPTPIENAAEYPHELAQAVGDAAAEDLTADDVRSGGRSGFGRATDARDAADRSHERYRRS